jgi:hypothetical protein
MVGNFVEEFSRERESKLENKRVGEMFSGAERVSETKSSKLNLFTFSEFS